MIADALRSQLHLNLHLASPSHPVASEWRCCTAGRKPWTVPVRSSQPVVDSIAWNPKHLVVASAGAYTDSAAPKQTGNIIVYAPLVSS